MQVFCVRMNCTGTANASGLTVALLVLLIVTVCAALDCPTLVTAKFNCDGLTFSPDSTCPVPLRGTVTGVTPGVEEETVNVAALPPAAVGVKITCTLQLLPLASVAPQVVTPVAKLLDDACPVTWKPTLAIGTPPVLIIVSVNGALATPTCCPAKLKLDGLTPIAAASTPVPARATVCVRSASLIVSVPVWLPSCVGA